MATNLTDLGTLQPDGTIELYDKGRDYQRILTTPEQRNLLGSKGYQATVSSFILGIQDIKGDLMIVFKNGSQYLYNNVGHLFDRMMSSNSKGKFFWKYIRNKAGFKKLSQVINLGISKESDEDLFRGLARQNIDNINKVIKKAVESNLVTISGLSYMKLNIGGIIMYQPIKLNN